MFVLILAYSKQELFDKFQLRFFEKGVIKIDSVGLRGSLSTS